MMEKNTRKIKSAALLGGSVSRNRRLLSTQRNVPLLSASQAGCFCINNMNPWVPAPAKTSRNCRVRLQSTLPLSHSNSGQYLEQDYLSTEEEKVTKGQMGQYEEKISMLMNHVDSLENKVELQKSVDKEENKEDLLNTSGDITGKHNSVVQNIEEELIDKEKENYFLHKSVDITKFASNTGTPVSLEGVAVVKESVSHTKTVSETVLHPLSVSEKELISREKEMLLKKLIEVEIDGQAAQQHVHQLRDVIRRLREDNHLAMTSAESVALAKLKEAFFEKMADFEAANRTLRRLLRAQRQSEGEVIWLTEQQDALLHKVADTEAINEHLQMDAMERDRTMAALQMEASAQRDETVALGKLKHSLEATRAHLQRQLRTKEADCDRMTVQIRTLDSQLREKNMEVDHLRILMHKCKNSTYEDKECLKKATRAQKIKAERCELELGRVRRLLMEQGLQIEELNSQLLPDKSSHPGHDSFRLDEVNAEQTSPQKHVHELEALLDRVEKSSKSQVDALTSHIREKCEEINALRLENERLKSSVSSTEFRLKTLEGEACRLKRDVKHNEQLSNNFKDQLEQSHRESSDSVSLLEEHKLQSSQHQHSSELELEKVKRRLYQRLQELEPVPDLLRTTELRLHGATEKVLKYERCISENSELIAELTATAKSHLETVDVLRGKLNSSVEESRLMAVKMESMDERLQAVDEANKELVLVVTRKDEVCRQMNLRLEEKTRESGHLTRQLENSLSDLRLHLDNAQGKFASKERTYQTRLTGLESQLNQFRVELARIKREKEENECKFNSRLSDLKDRLDQSHSTNRSMQNYVQFLKKSYTNVFGDSSPSYGRVSPLHPTIL